MAALALLGAGFFARDAIEGPASPPPRAQAVDPTEVTVPAGPTPTIADDGVEPIAEVAEAIGPAVVLITTGDGLGSGVIYDASGLILTNAHVVGSDRTVQVRLVDGTTVEGDVLGADGATDIAVVAIDPPVELPVARLAEGEPRVGQLAVALGSPFGLEQTVTAGIVSAVDRPVPNDRGVAVNMIQTDAPINPGNSGGALANRNGEVIGINTAIFSESGENNGIGFAVPIAKAREIAQRIVDGESLAGPRLGVSGDGSDRGEPGARVVDVAQGSAADQAGILPGDLIVAVDGERVRNFAELQGRIGSYRPGDTVTVEVQRDGQTFALEVTLGS